MARLKKALRQGATSLGLITKPQFVARVVHEHPPEDAIEAGVVYVVGGPGYQKWAVFRCPGNEYEIIQLALMKKYRPRWKVVIDFLERPTIYPSILQLKGSFAHFWVRNGRVEWCADTGKHPVLFQ